jgi:hypothetical protein
LYRATDATADAGANSSATCIGGTAYIPAYSHANVSASTGDDAHSRAFEFLANI